MGAEDDIIGFYQRHAEAFVARRRGRIDRHVWLDRFVAAMPAGRRVLDLGCGFGTPLGAYLVARGCAVTGVDTSAPLIARARADFPDEDWIVGDMRGLDLGTAFDGVLAWNSFFHLSPPDQRAMFATFRAHAAPGAVLLFTSGTSNGVAMGEMFGEPLYHASLDPEEYRACLDAAGFDVLHHVAEDPECGQHTVWLARRR
ncbi:class I SAM-dependent methyltransferase [Pseudaestuariivita atlantica]|uniref:Methyltransferase n=1 Tax=Pseudaestuariivita atlantica TaxID=1317121 RepID=A0A0L1JKR4_9RHOB|nr:class I SAM-dependent methyltransferase [Pseudaestuariivita atlantica]KNG92345.1 methyltransferase [Pseudaestuariivita atlantica]